MPSSTWKIVHDPTHLYFITTAAIRHQPIFEREVIKRILVDCLNTGRVLGRYQLYAFVIMQNHIHLILKPEAGHRVDAIVCAYKKASAGLIVRHLAAERRIEFSPGSGRIVRDKRGSGMPSARENTRLRMYLAGFFCGRRCAISTTIRSNRTGDWRRGRKTIGGQAQGFISQ